MDAVEWEIKQLEADVEREPGDAFLRCNVACLLASTGAYRRAFAHLGVAMDVANGSMAAGCVTSAIRQLTDEYARLWQLPNGSPHLELVS